MGHGRSAEAVVLLAQARETYVQLGAAPLLADLELLVPEQVGLVDVAG